MSTTYSLVCRETRKKLWIGQGTRIYYGNPGIMERLRLFLYDHEGKSLVFVSDHDEEACDYDEYREDMPDTPADATPEHRLDQLLSGRNVVLPVSSEHAEGMMLVAGNYLAQAKAQNL